MLEIGKKGYSNIVIHEVGNQSKVVGNLYYFLRVIFKLI